MHTNNDRDLQLVNSCMQLDTEALLGTELDMSGDTVFCEGERTTQLASNLLCRPR